MSALISGYYFVCIKQIREFPIGTGNNWEKVPFAHLKFVNFDV
jgi:hypothetical protein